MSTKKEQEPKTPEQEILTLQNKLKAVELKSIELYNELQSYRANIAPEAMRMKAELSIELEIAHTFIKSGAFPNITKEQAYVLMKAGQEMGLGKVESLQSLYITPKGKIEPYGKGTINFITRAGYEIEYLNETAHSVDVRIFRDGYDRTEKVTDQDQVIAGGKAIGFAKKNKMRFHGVKMHLSFNLPHLIKAVADPFTVDFIEQGHNTPETKEVKGVSIKAITEGKRVDRVLSAIYSAKTPEELYRSKEAAYNAALSDAYEAKMDELETQFAKNQENNEQ